MLSKLLSTTAIATALVAAMPASISSADEGAGEEQRAEIIACRYHYSARR